MSDKKNPQTIEDRDLDSAQGGAIDAFLKLGDIDGESKEMATSTSYDLVGKRDIGTGARTGSDTVPTESFSLNYEKIR